MSKVEVGFVRELPDVERAVVEKKISSAKWKIVPVWKMSQKIEKYNPDWANIIDEKAEELGITDVKETSIKVDDVKYTIFNDGKNLIYMKRVSKSKGGSGSKCSPKKDHVLDLIRAFLEKKGEFTIGEFMKYTKERGESYYRPYIFNIIRKHCIFEYRPVGKRNVIFVKGVKE